MTKTLSFTLKIDREMAKQLVSDYLILQEMIGEKERPYITSVTCQHGAILAEFQVAIKEEENA